MPHSRLTRFAAIAGFTALAACAGKPPDDVACPNSEVFRLPVETAPIPSVIAGETPLGPPAPGTAADAIMTAMSLNADNGDGARRIAVLSGGGEFGAYGAGFFQSYLADRPFRFDVVTGVSTGALQATGVFLGEADDLQALVDGYAIDRETDLAIERANIGGLPLRDSIYSLGPARERFGAFLSNDRIDRVAAAGRAGRRLLIGVVEVQDGQFYAIDLTAIAASDRPVEERRQCYVEAVFASAAVPVIFPPVVLDGKQYFDGGVRASVFLDSAIAALDAMAPEQASKTKAYVLFNGYLDTPPQEGPVTGLTETIGRTRAITYDQIDRTSLGKIARLASRIDVAWARIEPGLCQGMRELAPGEDVFNAPFMNCLIREGATAGAGDAPFMHIAP